jgi:hypothetical protein
MTDHQPIDPQLNARFDELYTPLSNLDRLQKSPPLLAHYTSIEVMEKILLTEALWFSNPLLMNDLQEMRLVPSEGWLELKVA